MANDSEHILGSFEQALRDSKNAVLTMASVAQRNLEHAVRGTLERNVELCNEAIADDDEVNNFERLIDKEGIEILLRFNPVASDLRQVLATMKIANNLERISDQAENIARRGKKIIKQSEVAETRVIEPLYDAASSLLEDSIRSFSEGDMALGLTLHGRDQDLDKAHSRQIKELTKAIERDQENLKVYLNLIFIGRCLERVGDHAVNIAEDAVFVESATDIRHVGPEALSDETLAEINGG